METDAALFKMRATYQLVKRDADGNVLEVLEGESPEQLVRAQPDGTIEPVSKPENDAHH